MPRTTRPRGCNTGSTYCGGVDGPGVAGTYARKHNPAMSFTSVSGTGQCANIQPLAKFDPNVNVAFVVPNLCNDAHDCSLATADTFLKGVRPEGDRALRLGPHLAGHLVRRGLDRARTGAAGSSPPSCGRACPASSRRRSHTHYSLLRTIENLNGLPCLGSSCSANTLSEFLH